MTTSCKVTNARVVSPLETQISSRQCRYAYCCAGLYIGIAYSGKVYNVYITVHHSCTYNLAFLDLCQQW